MTIIGCLLRVDELRGWETLAPMRPGAGAQRCGDSLTNDSSDAGTDRWMPAESGVLLNGLANPKWTYEPNNALRNMIGGMV